MILKALPRAKVLFLAGFHVGPCQVREAEASGAVGVLPKTLGLEDVVSAIHAVVDQSPSTRIRHRGGRSGMRGNGHEHGDQCETSSDDEAAKLTQGVASLTSREASLTSREIEILQLLCQGQPSQELGAQLGITVGTLKNHVHKILSKLQARTQLEAIHMARHEGVISARDVWARPRGEGSGMM